MGALRNGPPRNDRDDPAALPVLAPSGVVAVRHIPATERVTPGTVTTMPRHNPDAAPHPGRAPPPWALGAGAAGIAVGIAAIGISTGRSWPTGIAPALRTARRRAT